MNVIIAVVSAGMLSVAALGQGSGAVMNTEVSVDGGEYSGTASIPNCLTTCFLRVRVTVGNIVPPYDFAGVVFQPVFTGMYRVCPSDCYGDFVDVGPACDTSNGGPGIQYPFGLFPMCHNTPSGPVAPFFSGTPMAQLRISGANNPSLTEHPEYGLDCRQLWRNAAGPSYNDDREVVLYRADLLLQGDVPRSRTLVLDVPPEGIYGQAIGFWTDANGGNVIEPMDRSRIRAALVTLLPAPLLANGGFESPGLFPQLPSGGFIPLSTQSPTGWTYTGGGDSTFYRLTPITTWDGEQAVGLADGDSLAAARVWQPNRHYRAIFHARRSYAANSDVLNIEAAGVVLPVRQDSGVFAGFRAGTREWWRYTAEFQTPPSPPDQVLRLRNPAGAQSAGAWFLDGVSLETAWIVADPVTTTACTGQTRTFTALAGGDMLAYQWTRDGRPVIDGATGTGSWVMGATGPQLTIIGVTPRDYASYACVVSNDMGLATSAAAALTPPSFDLNQDGNTDQDDVAYLIEVVAGGMNPLGIDPDMNADGNVDQDDVAAFIDVVAGGPCP